MLLWERYLLAHAAQMCCSFALTLLLACIVLAIATALLARLALRQWCELAKLSARLEVASAAKPVKRVTIVEPTRTVSTQTDPLPESAPSPWLSDEARTEFAAALEAIVRHRQKRAYEVGIEGERAWVDFYFALVLHARWIVPGPALLELLLPGDGSYPVDGSAPTQEQAKALGRTLGIVTRGDRERVTAGQPALAYDMRVTIMDEDPAQRMMDEARRMREAAEAQFLAACPPIVTLSPTVSSVGDVVGPAPTPRIVVQGGATDEAIVAWNDGVQRATAASSPSGENPPGYDSAFVSGASAASWPPLICPAVHRAIEQLGIHSSGPVQIPRRPRPNRETPPAFSPGVLEPPSYFNMTGDATRADG